MRELAPALDLRSLTIESGGEPPHSKARPPADLPLLEVVTRLVALLCEQ